MEKYTLYLVFGFVACVEEEGWGELRGLYRAERFVLAVCNTQGAAALCAFELQGHSLGSHKQGLPTVGWCAPQAEAGWEKGGFSQCLGDAVSGCSRVNF